MTYNKTFKILLAVLFLLPLFFIPGGALSLVASKAMFLSFGVVIIALVFIWETWKAGRIEIPWHPVMLSVVLLPAVYFLSALLSTPSSLSLLGYNFEVGTFGFILLVSTLFIIISIVITDTARILEAITALLVSFSLVTIFAAIKILSGYPTWGVFFGRTGNPLGNWTDLGTIIGLLSALTALVLGQIPMAKPMRIAGYFVFAVSLALSAILNFSSVFIFTLIAAILLFAYFSRIERGPGKTVLPVILGVFSIIFLINPNLGASVGTLGEAVTGIFGTSNAEIKPTLSTTLDISKAVLSQGTLFGSGPNTFSRDWLVYKPVNVNTTPFWSVNFSFGSGFIPTQVATTGLAGTMLWLSLLALLAFIGIKVFSSLPESRGERLALASSFLAALYLWTASFMYAPSLSLLTLTFIFSALFISAAQSRTGAERQFLASRSFDFSRDAATRTISVLLLSLGTLGFLALGYKALNKTLSVFYFQKAANLSNTAGSSLNAIEAAINRTIKFAPADIYYASLSRIYFAKAEQAAQATTGTQEENQKTFQSAVSSSIQAARQAVALNPKGFENWLALGTIYAALVPAPLSVQGAYENAKFAYLQAGNMNPNSPETPLLLAQLEVNKGDLAAARDYVSQAVILKEDYPDAYLLLARIEIQNNNLPGAIASTEKLVLLSPNNPALYLELGLLKSANADDAGALAAYLDALEQSPDYANAKYYLGLTLEKLGRKDEAKRQFEELLISNPESAELKEALERLK